MIYGDEPMGYGELNRAQKELMGKLLSNPNYTDLIPDLNSILQSGNLYAYCMNNPVMYTDPSGESATLTATIIGGIIVAVVVSVMLAELAKEAIKNTSKERQKHILHGSRNGHEDGWRKFGIDPNDPNGFELILPIIREAIEKGEQSGWNLKPTGVFVQTITYYFEKFAQTVIVMLVKHQNGVVELSDAYVKY